MQNKLNGIKEFESNALELKIKYFIVNNKVLGPAEVIEHGIKRNIYYCLI